VVDEVLAALAAEGLQSDTRFAESFARSRMERGFGARRVELELQQHQIESTIIGEVLAEAETDPVGRAVVLVKKRLGSGSLSDRATEARITRYLAGRGFGYGDIREALARVRGDE